MPGGKTGRMNLGKEEEEEDESGKERRSCGFQAEVRRQGWSSGPRIVDGSVPPKREEAEDEGWEDKLHDEEDDDDDEAV